METQHRPQEALRDEQQRPRRRSNDESRKEGQQKHPRGAQDDSLAPEKHPRAPPRAPQGPWPLSRGPCPLFKLPTESLSLYFSWALASSKNKFPAILGSKQLPKRRPRGSKVLSRPSPDQKRRFFKNRAAAEAGARFLRVRGSAWKSKIDFKSPQDMKNNDLEEDRTIKPRRTTTRAPEKRPRWFLGSREDPKSLPKSTPGTLAT